MDQLPIPVCKVCYKSLPVEFQGFDICPMCLLKAEERRAKGPHFVYPSYQSPLTRLDRSRERNGRL